MDVSIYKETHTLCAMMWTPPSLGTLPQLSDLSPLSTLSSSTGLFFLIISRFKVCLIFKQTNKQTVPSWFSSASSSLYSQLFLAPPSSLPTPFKWLLSGFCPNHFSEIAHAKVTYDLWLPNPIEFFSSYLTCPFWLPISLPRNFWKLSSLGFLQY